MRKIITEELKQNIKDYYQSRPMTIGEVCKEFSLSSPTVLKILNGIQKYSKTKIYNPEWDEDFFSNSSESFAAEETEDKAEEEAAVENNTEDEEDYGDEEDGFFDMDSIDWNL